MLGDRILHVISDLHLGGLYGRGPGDRGFRMCTQVGSLQRYVEHITAAERPAGRGLELVINGDFIDFLAEGTAGGWKPVIFSPSEAVAKLDAIVRRDQGFFDALGKLLAAGHALTVLLGNHDVELAYPAVEAAIRRHLGVTAASAFTFIRDGEPYVVGDALIEHGNRHDGFNRIDHRALTEACAMQARGESTEDGPFQAPPGSRLVAFVMNPIKAQYPFVDLLKPETGSVLPILAALAPSVRWKIPQVLWLKAQASLRRDVAARAGAGDDDDDGGFRGADIAAGEQGDGDEGPVRRAGRGRRRKSAHEREEDALRALLVESMGAAGAETFLRELAAADPPAAASGGQGNESEDEDGSPMRGRDIASPSGHILRLLASVDPRGLKARLPALLDALRIVQKDASFDVGVETEEDYQKAAQAHADRGHRHVVFGHTHLAKCLPLEGGATYLNTGTWADLIAFPKEILLPDATQAQAELWSFVDDLENGQLQKHIRFQPTYARLDLGGEKVARADLCFWKE